MTDELDFVARAARPALDDAPAIPTGLDWDEVVHLAAWHRLGPLLYRYVRRDRSVVPETVFAHLQQSFQQTGTTNVYLRHELDRVAAALHGEGVPVMALKGMALVDGCYDELGLRPMVDFDILVPSKEYERAGQLLAGVGYGGYNGFVPGTDDRTRGPLVKPDGLAAVDLHGHLADDVPHLDEAAMWGRAHQSERGPYLLAANEDLLVHLAVHFVTHRGFTSEGAIGQLADIAWVIAAGLDWDALTRQALDAHVAARLHLALVATADVLASGIPPATLSALRPDGDDREMTQRFVRERVRATRTWHHPEYFHKRVATSYSKSGRPLGRLLPSRELLAYRYGRDDERPASYARLYVRRLRQASAPLRRSNVVADEQIHRWVRSLDA